MKSLFVSLFIFSAVTLTSNLALADFEAVDGVLILECSHSMYGLYTVNVYLDDYNSKTVAELSVNSVDGPIQVSTYTVSKPQIVSRGSETLVDGPGFSLVIDNASLSGSFKAVLDHGREITSFGLKCSEN